ncbi:MAG: glycosyltransferase family protein [Actinomycetota bacterium]
MRTVLITTEIAQMLADSLEHLGAHAWVVRERDHATPTPEVLVIVGAGPEFGSLERLLSSWPKRPFTILWALEPFPPPDLPEDTVRRGQRMAEVDARLRLPENRLGVTLRHILPNGLRERASRLRARLTAGSGALIDRGHQAAPGRIDRHAFRRLRWVTRNVQAGSIGHVMVTNTNAVRILADHGIHATRAPVGYHRWMGGDLSRARDIDVAFLGNPAGARAGRLATIKEELAQLGIALTVPLPIWERSERTAFLSRTRVLVNLRSNSWHPELERFVLAAANGALVVSEAPIPATEPFVNATHFVAVPANEIPDTVAHYIDHENERRAIADNAHELVTTEVTMAAVAHRVLAVAAGIGLFDDSEHRK